MNQCSKCGKPTTEDGQLCLDCQHLEVALGLAQEWRRHVDRDDPARAAQCVRQIDLLVSIRGRYGLWTYPSEILDAMGLARQASGKEVAIWTRQSSQTTSSA